MNASAPPPPPPRRGRVLFLLSGSIACFKACQVLSRLVQDGHEVEVAATRSALRFVGEATLEGLSGRKVHLDTFERGDLMQHLHLTRWADLTVLAPATASTLNRLAAGLGDDLVSTLFLAHDFSRPYLVAPAMNTRMFHHPATREGLRRLAGWGVQVLASPAGALACGETGEGRMLEPDLLYREILRRLPAEGPPPPGARRVLVTSGGTREPIDGVRFIGNASTGATGAAIASALLARGHRVTLLHAEGSVEPVGGPHPGLSKRSFSTFASLDRALGEELASTPFDAAIHLAAVGDYSVDALEADGLRLAPAARGKLDSGQDLVLRLRRNPKLVATLKARAGRPDLRVIAFKLTDTEDALVQRQAVARLAAEAEVDWIVHNDLSWTGPQAALRAAVYSGQAAAAGGPPEATAASGGDLARILVRLVEEGAPGTGEGEARP